MNKPQINDPQRARDFFKAKLEFTTGPIELHRMRLLYGDELNVVDVRAAADYDEGHIPGAVSLPRDRWPTCAGMRLDKLNVIYCYHQQCHLAAKAAAAFAAHGYPVMELEGGFLAWKDHGLEIEHLDRAVQAA